MRNALLAASLVLPAIQAQAEAQSNPKKSKPVQAHPGVDQAKVDAAIRKGVAYIKQSPDGMGTGLVLLAFLHAGRDIVAEADPVFQSLLKTQLESDLTQTYEVSITAMILEELDRVKYQGRLWQCAQFLVDNQCRNGMWNYGEPTPFVKDIPTGTPVKRDVATKPAARDFSDPPPGPRKVVRTMPVTKRRDGPESGDNSNSQYAALGLRACHDAGIILPKDVVRKAHQWWSDHRSVEGKEEGAAKATGAGANSSSWGYGGEGTCGAMTAGAVGALAIYDYILDDDGGRKKSWWSDPAVRGGLEWLARNFVATHNPGQCDLGHPPKGLYAYYLYAVERAGLLVGTEAFGRHEWYPAGANELLKSQKPDGSWGGDICGPVVDTCFAILFLRRATRPLDVASVDPFKRK